MKHPTVDQLNALRKYATANGRTWKSKLNTLWVNGAYQYAVLGGADSGLLQQVRNQFGPSWLVRFRLPDPEPRYTCGIESPSAYDNEGY